MTKRANRYFRDRVKCWNCKKVLTFSEKAFWEDICGKCNHESNLSMLQTIQKHSKSLNQPVQNG